MLTLNEYSINIALQSYNIVGFMMENLKKKSSFLPGAYNTHNATWVLTVW